MVKKYLLIALLMVCGSGFAQSQSASNLVKERLKQRAINTSHGFWSISSEHVSTASNIRHIYFQQAHFGIPIEGSESSLHLSVNNELISENIRFITSEELKAITTPSTVIGAQTAVARLSQQMGYRIKTPIEFITNSEKKTNKLWLTNGGISQRDIGARLIYSADAKNSYRLTWEIDILEMDHSHWWEFQVDAESGEILRKLDRMNSCATSGHSCEGNSALMPLEALAEAQEEKKNWPMELIRPVRVASEVNAACSECYEVFDYPLESPYFGDRTIVENPADLIASPYGWHDTDGTPGPEYFTTRGNNVDAYEANDNFGYHPDGGITLNFTGFPFDTEYSSATQYEDASITNLFYWSNLIHDITYNYGFTEAAQNFQVNNYGRGGEEGDDIIAFGQSVDRPCNGSFSTPPDGERPLMIINLCGSKDGNFDTTLIAHEWGHGLSSRLSGGGVFTNCLRHEENPMEGWCDWVSAILTIKEGDTGETPRYIASYLRNHGPNGPGVRFWAYSTSMSINPLTYADLPNRQGVHRIGAIWGQMIWEMTWALIDEFGYNPDITNFTGNINQDAGNVMALAIVIEGLKLTPCQPGFVDARDGIITAARQIYGREVLCPIWDAFAKRGLGASADQGESDDQRDGTAAYDTPGVDAFFVNDFQPFCIEAADTYTNLTGGHPRGGVYSGIGVTDNGDGETFDFDPVGAGVGVHTITYTVDETICTSVDTASIQVRVVLDTVPPEIDCIADPSFIVPNDEPYVLNDFIAVTPVQDDCSGVLEVTQSPEAGTLITASQSEIVISARDIAGNESSCSFILNLTFVTEMELQLGEIFLTPNPTRDQISLINPQEERINNIEIWDMIGRRVFYSELNNKAIENMLSVEEFSAGTYFVMINSSKGTKMIRLVKL